MCVQSCSAIWPIISAKDYCAETGWRICRALIEDHKVAGAGVMKELAHGYGAVAKWPKIGIELIIVLRGSVASTSTSGALLVGNYTERNFDFLHFLCVISTITTNSNVLFY